MQFFFLLVSNIIRAVDGISKIIRANCVHGFSPNCPLNVNCCSATAIEFYKGTAGIHSLLCQYTATVLNFYVLLF